MLAKPRNFICPETGENCVEGACTATRCIQRARDEAAAANARGIGTFGAKPKRKN
jgi:hypothetical protein